MNARGRETRNNHENEFHPKENALKEIELIDSKKLVWIGTDANLFDIKAGNDLNFVLGLIRLFDRYEKGELIEFNSIGY